MSAEKTTRTGRPGPGGRRPGRGAIVAGFAALFLALFLGFAITQGIGKPSVPSDAIAVVEDAPGETRTVTDCHGDEVEEDPGTITKAEFDCAMLQTAARSGLQTAPKPDSPQYESIKSAAIGDLFDLVWIQGEAAERGISVSDREIDAQLEQILTQNFRCPSGNDPFDCEEFQAFLERSNFSEDDVFTRVRLQLLSTEIQRRITEQAQSVSADEIEDYYEAAKDQFVLPALREVRLVLNRDKAKVEEAAQQLEADDSDANWQKVALEFSTDPVSMGEGGLRPGISEGLLEEPLNREIFDASVDEIVGPIRTPLGWYVFQVQRITAEREQPLSEVQAEIRPLITQRKQQDAFNDFVNGYGSKWQSRTICAEDFLVERCSNFAGGQATGDPACSEDDPKRGRPDACPAPVRMLVPALPGTVTALAEKGVQLPQRPRPLGLDTPAQPVLPGSGGGGLTP